MTRWTREEDHLLLALWEEGLSASDIAGKLGKDTDVPAIVEQVNDDISEISVRLALFHLVRERELKKRRYRGYRYNGYQVKKPKAGGFSP